MGTLLLMEIVMEKLVLAAVLGSLVSGSVLAQNESRAGWFVGVGLTQVQAEESLLEPKNYLLEAGYNFNNGFAIEYQFTGTYSEKSFDDDFVLYVGDPVDGNVSYDGEAEISLKTSALFGSYTFGNKFYGKVKAGFMKAEYTFDSDYDTEVLDGDLAGETFSFKESISEDETGWAAGVGAGYEFSSSSSVELEYITTQDKIDLKFISLAYKYSF